MRFDDIDRIATVQDVGHRRNARVVRRIDGAVIALTQQDVAASMVAMMMGDQNGGQSEGAGIEVGDQRNGSARVDSDGMMVVVPDPDVIVLERGQGNESQHDEATWREKRLCYPSCMRDGLKRRSDSTCCFGSNAISTRPCRMWSASMRCRLACRRSISCATAESRCV